MCNQSKNTHGGANRGQGRKSLNRERVNVMLDRELLEKLPPSGGRSDFINDAIRYYLQNKPVRPAAGSEPKAGNDSSRCVVVQVFDYQVIKWHKDSPFVRLFFADDATYVFRLSSKQFNKLGADYRKMDREEDLKFKPKLLCVIENDHYVWSGLEYIDYSDRSFLEEKFEAVSVERLEIEESVTIHRPEKKEPVHVEPDPSLVR